MDGLVWFGVIILPLVPPVKVFPSPQNLSGTLRRSWGGQVTRPSTWQPPTCLLPLEAPPPQRRAWLHRQLIGRFKQSFTWKISRPYPSKPTEKCLTALSLSFPSTVQDGAAWDRCLRKCCLQLLGSLAQEQQGEERAPRPPPASPVGYFPKHSCFSFPIMP